MDRRQGITKSTVLRAPKLMASDILIETAYSHIVAVLKTVESEIIKRENELFDGPPRDRRGSRNYSQQSVDSYRKGCCPGSPARTERRHPMMYQLGRTVGLIIDVLAVFALVRVVRSSSGSSSLASSSMRSGRTHRSICFQWLSATMC